MAGNASGQEIVEELDALAMGSPTAADGDHFRSHNPMSPNSTDWSRALGWAGGSPFQVASQSHPCPHPLLVCSTLMSDGHVAQGRS